MIFLKLPVAFLLMIFVVAIGLFFEGLDRAAHAKMQRRYGPPVMQGFYDFIKLLGKENIVPRWSLSWMYNFAPWLAVVASLMVFLFIPMGSFEALLGADGDVILILYLLSLSGVAIAMGGFASSNPLANIGAQRELVLMMSYELPLAVVVTTFAWFAHKVGMIGNSFALSTFVHESIWANAGVIGVIGIICLFASMLAVIPAETTTGLMDITEAKTEILEGVTIEYSGTNLALLHVAFNLRALAISAVIVCLFLPWNFGPSEGMLWGVLSPVNFLWFWVKVFVVALFGVTFLRTIFGRLKVWQAARFYWFKVAALSLAGMILMSVDVLVR